MRIHCLNKISPVGLKRLPADYQLVDSINDSEAVLVRSAAMHEIELPAHTLAVARAGAGVNNIPLDKYADKGVVVFNTPGANANAVKELTIAMMLLAARDIRGSMEWVKDNKADPEINKTMEKAKSAFAGTEILGKTLGVIGCGAIGALVADAASKLGMRVLGVEPSEKTLERYADLLKETKIVSYDELFKEADYITIHVPLMDATRGLLNKEAFDKMKDGVIIINAARDALVNDDDLKEALDSGKVRKYVTDFPNAKTANMDKVVAISHLGASTEEAEDNCASMAVDQVVNYIENGNLINSVNFPSVDLEKKIDHRVLVLARGELPAELLSLAKWDKLATATKGNSAVLLAEIKEIPEGLEDRIKALSGVVRVRIL